MLSSYAQENSISANARISILTCGPGNQLYSSFGHSAFRIWDPVAKTDYVYNYGTFNFEAPNFYLNFTMGRPLFRLNKEIFPEFLYEYQYFKRWVNEQVLNLTHEQKLKLYHYLENNAKPENRDYKYDYVKDNCATKIIDVLKEVYGDEIVFNKNHLEKKLSVRELMREYLDINSWGSFGIDIALGSKIDREATAIEHTFIPDYVASQAKNSTINGKALVAGSRQILKKSTPVKSINFMGTPLFWFSILLMFIIFISIVNFKNKLWSRWLDVALFFITGVAGIILLLLWFTSDHVATAYNVNLLWAMPFNIVVFFYLVRKKELPAWLNTYCIVALSCLGLALIAWLFGIQSLHPAFGLIILILAIRYFLLWMKTSTKQI